VSWVCWIFGRRCCGDTAGLPKWWAAGVRVDGGWCGCGLGWSVRRRKIGKRACGERLCWWPAMGDDRGRGDQPWPFLEEKWAAALCAGGWGFFGFKGRGPAVVSRKWGEDRVGRWLKGKVVCLRLSMRGLGFFCFSFPRMFSPGPIFFFSLPRSIFLPL